MFRNQFLLLLFLSSLTYANPQIDATDFLQVQRKQVKKGVLFHVAGESCRVIGIITVISGFDELLRSEKKLAIGSIVYVTGTIINIKGLSSVGESAKLVSNAYSTDLKYSDKYYLSSLGLRIVSTLGFFAGLAMDNSLTYLSVAGMIVAEGLSITHIRRAGEIIDESETARAGIVISISPTYSLNHGVGLSMNLLF